MSNYKPYRPNAWYWIVGADTNQVFSSAAGAYVPNTDATYIAFLNAGGVPTKIDTEDNLWDVLADQSPSSLPAANTAAQDMLKNKQINKLDVVSFKVAFNHENRIRALEGKAAITQAQFLNALKALL